LEPRVGDPKCWIHLSCGGSRLAPQGRWIQNFGSPARGSKFMILLRVWCRIIHHSMGLLGHPLNLNPPPSSIFAALRGEGLYI
jgi:hypothetical protein